MHTRQLGKNLNQFHVMETEEISISDDLHIMQNRK